VDQSRFLGGYTFEDQSNKAMILTTLAIAVYQIAFRKKKNMSWKNEIQPYERPSRYAALDKTLPFVLITFITIYLNSDSKSVSELRYIGAYNSTLASEGLYFLISFFSMLTFCLIFSGKFHSFKISIYLKISAVLSFFWQLRLLVVGDRNTFFLIAFIQLIGYIHFYKRIGIIRLVIIALSSVYLYLAIENYRMNSSRSLMTIGQLQNVFQGINPSSWETSLNITAISLRATLDFIPQYSEHSLGLYKLIGIMAIVPFSRGILLSPNLEFTDTSQLVSNYIFGSDMSWQVGTSFIGDSYIDFGIFGVIAFSYLVGMFARIIQVEFERHPDPLSITLYLISASMAVQYSRYTVDFPIRPLIWCILLFWLFGNSKLSRRMVSK